MPKENNTLSPDPFEQKNFNKANIINSILILIVFICGIYTNQFIFKQGITVGLSETVEYYKLIGINEQVQKDIQTITTGTENCQEIQIGNIRVKRIGCEVVRTE